ncbi:MULTISPECIES: helix-turn-helix domain-containing protein [Stappiaceae]|uniref:Uncharacterized protein n=1 Tax=Pseudovibrio exalbescens TaxID=197461 RepID=A0A1U7JJZ7_9HYPH|nr:MULTISPECIES: helix-turn-helix domain-containing protein [Pseudovibrio]MDX5595644.1 helix-turn-helix domain-containing protein [Pseudovibrio sp. SPO723]OKL45018.1 hypothetical protein A3843_05385 [Pseudovibrio exalbescens]
MADFEFDLLGDPIPEGFGKRGRPPHRVTDEKRKLVIQLLAFGWTLEKIAAALSITPPTLRKNYFRELKFKEEAKARVQAKCLSKLMEQVEAGNVSAIEKYMTRLERADQQAKAAALAHRGPSVAIASAQKLGKKEARKQQAHSYDGKYAPPEAPLLN